MTATQNSPALSLGVALMGLFAATCAAYLNAFDGVFQFDDYHVIVANAAVHTWEGWRASMPGIRPLLKLSYFFNWRLGADEPLGFHLFNLAVHLANATLAFFLCRRFMREVGEAERAGSIAFVAALLFALHPAQTEAVTYICGRSVALMACFYLAALLAYAEGEARHDPRLTRLLSPLLFIAAMLVKETAWTLPLALLLWERVAGRKSLRQAAAGLAVHGVVLLALGAGIVANDLYRHLLAVSLATRGPMENLAAQIHGVFYLISGPLFTLRLNADPVVDIARPWLESAAKGVLLLGVMAVGFWQWRARPWLGFALLWFFLHLLPTNSFIARLDVANDRQLYLPLVGPALMVAVGASRCGRRGMWAAAIVLALVLGGATRARNVVYASETRFWEVVATASPAKARAWNNLGYAYQQEGRADAARDAYARAIDLDPEYLRARANLRLLEETR